MGIGESSLRVVCFLHLFAYMCVYGRLYQSPCVVRGQLGGVDSVLTPCRLQVPNQAWPSGMQTRTFPELHCQSCLFCEMGSHSVFTPSRNVLQSNSALGLQAWATTLVLK